MSEENVNQTEEIIEKPSAPPRKKSFFSKRNFFVLFGGAFLLLFLVGLGVYLSYRFGYFDNYIKAQFVSKMSEMNIVFDADVFRVNANPLTLQLKNATFNDKITGEKLFRVGEANLSLSVKDLYAWQLSRDISLDTTDLQDVEAWVKFDENGKSNFFNIKLIESETKSSVNFKYSSVKFSLKEGIVHFGDVSRKINANAKNILFFLEPEDAQVPDEQKRYKFDFTSTDSNLVYDEKPIDPINIKTKGIADGKGAEITQLTLTSPIGENSLSGTITDWNSPKYNLNVESNVDLMQVQTFLPNGTALRGIGNFKGKVIGEGEKYKIDGEITSDALAANNIRLKALQINATVDGENSMYNANGKAIAEMLTFEDFKIDFPQLIGNVRGNGTDFKWVGELQAASAKSPDGSIAGLFISDAVAEYKDKQFNARFGNVRAKNFASDGVEGLDLIGQNIKLAYYNGAVNVDLPNLRAGVLKSNGTELRGVNAGNIKINNQGSKTSVNASTLRAENLSTKDAKVKNLTANNVNVTNQNGSTTIQANNAQAEQVDAKGAKVGNITANKVNVNIRGNQTDVVSDNVKVAKVETDAAVLGSLNVAGIRLKIVAGRIEGSSGNIDAGNVDLKKQGKLENVKLYKPVFVLEPSGRYRASADMSLGGGVLGSVKLGAAKASVTATNEQVALNNLTADVMDGKINGNAVVALTNRNQSKIDADFTDLDLAKLLALQGGKVVPIAGKTTGKANLTFQGTNFKGASGTLTADFIATAGTEERGLVPVNGKLGLRADKGLFNIDFANLNTEKSKIDASGRFDLEGNDSNLNIALNSTDATEIERLVKVLNLSPTLEEQLNSYQATFAGNLNFDGNLTGNLQDPTIVGKAQLASISLRGRDIGALTTNLLVSPAIIELSNGKLQQSDGGNVMFSVNVPRTGSNNISVQATLDRVNTGNLLAALPIEESLPEPLRDFKAQTSGKLNLTGLPNEMSGTAELISTNGSVAGQTFDKFDTKLTFQGNLVNIENFNIGFGDGYLTAKGTYTTDTKIFNLDAEAKNIQIERVIPLLTKSTDLPKITGTVDLTAKATGESTNFLTYNINFKGAGQDLVVNDTKLGIINFDGTTANQQLNAKLIANIGSQPQVITANLNFANENLPLHAETNFNQTELAPFIQLFRPSEDMEVTGNATGKVVLEGNLYQKDASGKGNFTTDNLKGTALFNEFALQIGETPFAATKPIDIRFSSSEIFVNNAQFAGAGSNVVVNGTKALTDNGINNFTVDGKVNLRIFNLVSKNAFFSGLADASVRLTGVNKDSRLNGTASVDNASISTFISSERLNFDRIKGRILFTSNQAQIEQVVGYLGGGKVVGSGGAVIEGLKLQRFRLEMRGTNVTAPLPKDFLTTGDAEIQLVGQCVGFEENKKCLTSDLDTEIAGRIFAKRALYTKDIDLADVVGSRREATIKEGTSPSLLGIPRLSLTIQGRDALVVRNNLADLTASIDMRITGDVDNPVFAGSRITANEGTVFFRNDKYEVRRGTLEFPPPNGDPVINLEAESDIKGYQVTVNLIGNLSETESLNATVRSNPALPQADVISLITTGSLSNTDTGIPTLAQSGLNTAAEILTDSLINNPARKATDKLFGLNKFAIDPIISGRRLSPTARLTVGRQINKNLAVTYSTNLSEDQNQVLALEYRLSNKLSFVAQYEQRSLSNVTRNSDNFSFEIRLRKRF